MPPPTARHPGPPAGRGTLPPPDAAGLARSIALQARIAARLRSAGGWLSFADYMHCALYEPGLGYYDAPGSKLGAAGDFVTAPEISPLFGQALAAPVADACARSMARVLEFGAGTGALAQQLLQALEQRGTPLHEYYILEVSADLRARQQKRLTGWPVIWLDRLPASFEGVMLANEVLDVLPVHLFVRTATGVLERGVEPDDNNTGHDSGGRVGLRFGGRPASAALVHAVEAVEACTGPLPAGYGSEVGLPAQAWLAAAAASLQRGLLLLIDYGFPCSEYYHPQRAMGTLMCHYRQHAHADPLWLPGLNDITAHVDFTAIARAARAAGLGVLGYCSQASFLLDCGILDRLGQAADQAAISGLQRLLSEAEMGELVKVLALGRGLDALACGFRRSDRRHRLGC